MNINASSQPPTTEQTSLSRPRMIRKANCHGPPRARYEPASFCAPHSTKHHQLQWTQHTDQVGRFPQCQPHAKAAPFHTHPIPTHDLDTYIQAAPLRHAPRRASTSRSTSYPWSSPPHFAEPSSKASCGRAGAKTTYTTHAGITPGPPPPTAPAKQTRHHPRLMHHRRPSTTPGQ